MEANDDGTVTFAGRRLTGEQVAEMAAALLTAMAVATEKAGRADEAKTRTSKRVPTVSPTAIHVRSVEGSQTPLLVLVCGAAHLGVSIPMQILRDLSRGVLTDLPPDRSTH